MIRIDNEFSVKIGRIFSSSKIPFSSVTLQNGKLQIRVVIQ